MGRPLTSADTTPFGARIGYLRERRGLTYRFLAGETGLSVAHLYQIEKGQTMPSAETLARLADAFGLTMDELYRGVGRGETIDRAIAGEDA